MQRSVPFSDVSFTMRSASTVDAIYPPAPAPRSEAECSSQLWSDTESEGSYGEAVERCAQGVSTLNDRIERLQALRREAEQQILTTDCTRTSVSHLEPSPRPLSPARPLPVPRPSRSAEKPFQRATEGSRLRDLDTSLEELRDNLAHVNTSNTGKVRELCAKIDSLSEQVMQHEVELRERTFSGRSTDRALMTIFEKIDALTAEVGAVRRSQEEAGVAPVRAPVARHSAKRRSVSGEVGKLCNAVELLKAKMDEQGEALHRLVTGQVKADLAKQRGGAHRGHDHEAYGTYQTARVSPPPTPTDHRLASTQPNLRSPVRASRHVEEPARESTTLMRSAKKQEAKEEAEREEQAKFGTQLDFEHAMNDSGEKGDDRPAPGPRYGDRTSSSGVRRIMTPEAKPMSGSATRASTTAAKALQYDATAAAMRYPPLLGKESTAQNPLLKGPEGGDDILFAALKALHAENAKLRSQLYQSSSPASKPAPAAAASEAPSYQWV